MDRDETAAPPGGTVTDLDVTGLRCPLPLLHAKRALREIEVGDSLRVHTTDPGSARDFASFARVAGHGFEAIDTGGDTFVLLLVKGQ
jgi:tRNA 2-thiouridine synthesizing protein A